MPLLMSVICISVIYFYFTNWYEYNKLPEEDKLIKTDAKTGEISVCLNYAHKYPDSKIARVVAKTMTVRQENMVVLGSLAIKYSDRTKPLRESVKNGLESYRKQESKNFKQGDGFNVMAREIRSRGEISYVDSYIKVAWLIFGGDDKYRQKIKKYWLDMFEVGEIPIGLFNGIIRSMYKL